MNLALESLKNLDRPTPFAQEIIDLFQKVIDKREQYTKVSERIKAVESFKGTIEKEIPRIVKKYTGIENDMVQLSKQVDGMVACMPLLYKNKNKKYDIDYTWDTYDIASGIPTQLSTEDIKDLKKVSEDFIKDGKVNNSKHVFKVSYVLYYDVYFTLCPKEVLSEKARYHTAKDCAADILHEIGHVVMLAEKAGETYIKARILQDRIIGYAKNQQIPISEKLGVARSILNKRIKDGTVSKNSILNKALTKAEEIQDSTIEYNGSSADFVMRVLNTVITFICCSGELLSNLPVAVVGYIFVGLGSVAGAIDDIFPTKGTANRGFNNVFLDKIDQKLSDLPVTKREQFYTEWYADNFAAKQGLYASSVNSLENLTYNSQFLMKQIGPMTSTVSLAIYNVYTTLSMLMYSPFLIFDEHGDNKSRYAEMRRSLISKIKKNDLPDNAKAFLLTEYEKSIDALSKLTYGSKAHTNALAAMKLLSAATNIVLAPVSHRTDKDAEVLREAFENLINNKLYISSAKLDLLIKKYKK